MTNWNPFGDALAQRPEPPARVSTRTVRAALEDTLMGYTRTELEVVLRDELELEWPHPDESPSDPGYSKRSLIQAYTTGWEVPRLIALAQR